MKTLLVAILLLSSLAFAKDKSKNYQMGTFTGTEMVNTGVFYNNIQCDNSGSVCSGDAGFGTEPVYEVTGQDGFLYLLEQASHAFNVHQMWNGNKGVDPLAALKPGDKVLFRVEKKKNGLLGGTMIVAYVPRADDPNKEAMFITNVSTEKPKPQKPTDNVAAMCASGRLTPDQQKQFCGN